MSSGSIKICKKAIRKFYWYLLIKTFKRFDDASRVNGQAYRLRFIKIWKLIDAKINRLLFFIVHFNKEHSIISTIKAHSNSQSVAKHSMSRSHWSINLTHLLDVTQLYIKINKFRKVSAPTKKLQMRLRLPFRLRLVEVARTELWIRNSNSWTKGD